MNYKKVKFINKEYNIPEDILLYIDLLSMTENVKSHIFHDFVQKLSNAELPCISDEQMKYNIEEQVSRFIIKLTDNGIYDRTVKDYINESEGYKLISKVNTLALEKSKQVLTQQMDEWLEGYEEAIQKKEASITGLGFSIWSGSFVNHAIYAAMQASKINEQEKNASKEYLKDMTELENRIEKRKNEDERQYIANIYKPNMEIAITVFAYELLDIFIADLIKYEKINKEILNYIHIERSNDLLKNLKFSQNKEAVLYKAFEACPYNYDVYSNALNYGLLDYETFVTAKYFKLNKNIISSLINSLGNVIYPERFSINYKAVEKLAEFTKGDSISIIQEITNNYVIEVKNRYYEVIQMLDDDKQCLVAIKSYDFESILMGNEIVKREAYRKVQSIVEDKIWNQLIEKCGHKNLLNEITNSINTNKIISNKIELDNYLIIELEKRLEIARQQLIPWANEKKQQQEKDEHEKKLEQEKLKIKEKNKRIGFIFGICILIVTILLAIILPPILDNIKIKNRENYVEKQIENIINPLENQMENATGVDVVIDYNFSLDNDWDTELWYKWYFCVRLSIFEDYRKSNSYDEQKLLTIMDTCKILEEIYQEKLSDVQLVDFRYDDIRIVLDYSGSGLLDIRDMSTYETFYYEEYWGNRYLHSLESEYVLDENVQSDQAKEEAYNNAIHLMDEKKYEEALAIFTKLGDYKDSVVKMSECEEEIEKAFMESRYNEAISLMTEQKYEEALVIFKELGDYKDSIIKIAECEDSIAIITESKYNEASYLISIGNYNEALDLLEEISDYKDSSELIKKCKFIICEEGDIVTFGVYEQDGVLTNGLEEIEWIVLTRDENRIFVISKYCLERMPFNSSLSSVTWENSSIRTWLNESFYNNSFSIVEKEKIYSTTFYTEGIETTDKIFLLDEEDASLLPKSILIAKATDYVSASYCNWFLRNTGTACNVAYVSSSGELGYYEDVDRNWWIRPVMWINVSE